MARTTSWLVEPVGLSTTKTPSFTRATRPPSRLLRIDRSVHDGRERRRRLREGIVELAIDDAHRVVRRLAPRLVDLHGFEQIDVGVLLSVDERIHETGGRDAH